MGGDQDEAFKAALGDEILTLGIETLSEDQTTLLAKHYSMLCRWNRRLNLTRITGLREAARMHYGECLLGTRFIGGAKTLLDIGSGAGFPAVPLAVARPDLQVTALEANQKKSLFLKEAKDELNLINLKVMTARLEEIDCSGYELLTSRALDRAEILMPFVVGGLSAQQRLMLYCGSDLITKLEGKVKIETHRVPHSEARFIAILSGRWTRN